MRREVCVAVPTDDGEYVKLGHFGDARFYYHYTYRGGEWLLLKKVRNPYIGQHVLDGEDEEELGKRVSIYQFNKDCDYIISVAFGKGGQKFMERRGLKVVKVKPRTTVGEALKIAEYLMNR